MQHVTQQARYLMRLQPLLWVRNYTSQYWVRQIFMEARLIQKNIISIYCFIKNNYGGSYEVSKLYHIDYRVFVFLLFYWFFNIIIIAVILVKYIYFHIKKSLTSMKIYISRECQYYCIFVFCGGLYTVIKQDNI